MKPQTINPAHSTRRNRVIAKTAKQKSARRSGSSSYQSNTGELLNRASKAVKIKPVDLQTWFESFPNLNDRTRDITLQLILQHRLDPRADEIDLVQYEVGCWQALITVNGWAKLINAQPAFCGIEFTESTELEDDIPRWMSCTIYRTDRIKPISVKEYFVELKTQHSCWQEMPRRMLRHRAKLLAIHPAGQRLGAEAAERLDQALRCALTNLMAPAAAEALAPPAGTDGALRYWRDRISVPRDMPLHAGRVLRAALERTAALAGPEQGPPLPVRDRRDQNPAPFVALSGR